jgi:hypothetical protein
MQQYDWLTVTESHWRYKKSPATTAEGCNMETKQITPTMEESPRWNKVNWTEESPATTKERYTVGFHQYSNKQNYNHECLEGSPARATTQSTTRRCLQWATITITRSTWLVFTGARTMDRMEESPATTMGGVVTANDMKWSCITGVGSNESHSTKRCILAPQCETVGVCGTPASTMNKVHGGVSGINEPKATIWVVGVRLSDYPNIQRPSFQVIQSQWNDTVESGNPTQQACGIQGDDDQESDRYY